MKETATTVAARMMICGDVKWLTVHELGRLLAGKLMRFEVFKESTIDSCRQTNANFQNV